MTNAELIEKLKKLPLDREVLVGDDEDLRDPFVQTIRSAGEDVIVL